MVAVPAVGAHAARTPGKLCTDKVDAPYRVDLAGTAAVVLELDFFRFYLININFK